MEFTQGAPFDSFGLSEATMRAIRNKGYEISTPVQAGCIPPMLEGKDVIAKAPTGTGKTFAFGIPIVERIDPESEEVQAVILAPTRELAMQITGRDARICARSSEGVRHGVPLRRPAHRQADQRPEEAAPDRGGHPGPPDATI